MIKEILMDITDIEEGIVAHQVNCRGVMGSGVAKAIREQWPKAYTSYIEYYRNNFKLGWTYHALMGQVNFVPCGSVTIANVFGQCEFGSGLKHTSYDAWDTAAQELARYAKEKRTCVYVPYKMGSDLGGGNWNIMSAILKEYLGDFVIACKLVQ